MRERGYERGTGRPDGERTTDKMIPGDLGPILVALVDQPRNRILSTNANESDVPSIWYVETVEIYSRPEFTSTEHVMVRGVESATGGLVSRPNPPGVHLMSF